jgi:uncharacterized repeat protein (TIGR03803 family)
MTKHHHLVLICAALIIGAITPALAQTPGLNTIYTFPTGNPAPTTGYHPWGGLAMDTSGTLYGTTYYGGNCANGFPNCGTIYKLTPPAAGQTAWSYGFLHGFSANPDGIEPVAPLTNYQNVMYGVASAGGDPACACGVVFSITTGGTYNILHTFDPHIPGPPTNAWPNGTTPLGGLLINNGTIYGTTNAGGTGAAGPSGVNGAGVLYSMTTTGANFTVLHNFDGDENGGPQGMIIFGQDGAIYGTQFGGGLYNQGVIWRMPIGGTYQVLYNFLGNNQPGNSSDGANPEGRLALGADGTIYGTTTHGGDPSGDGTAWSIKLVSGTWVYTQLYKFNGTTATSLPHSGLILAADGALYGTAAGGGTYGGGAFYKLLPNGSTWMYITLHNFKPLDVNGNSPYGDLLYVNNNFYGMNLSGGAVSQCSSNGCGTVFQFNLRSATHNLNGDGFSDIAWRDSSGNVAVWLMNGNQLLQGGGLGNASPTVWKIVGQRDFNGDGNSDLLWNDTSGNISIWFMNGAQVLQYASAPSAPGWTVVGTGDFNGDAMGDILLEDASGHLAIWLMNGTQISQAGGIGTLPSGWKVVGTGDFNSDGKTDILFENASGVLAIWFMNGVQIAQLGNPPAATAAWTVVGTGDFNGDGYSDILWRDNSNNLAVWLMQSTSILQAGSLGNVGTTWNVADTGDFNGDGKSDILWRDTSGNVAMWYMNGTAVLQSLGAGSAPLTWTIQGSNSD